MNAMNILKQLMNQTSGSQPGTGGGFGGVDVKSLLGGGAVGLMLGSKRGRKMGGTALKYGAAAGIGVLAWKAYQNYQAQSSGQVSDNARQGQPLEQLQGNEQEQRGLEILQAMIMAARADGHIDANERALLTQEIEKLGPDDELHAWIQQQFDAPLDANALARSADSPQASREIYIVSAVMIDDQNPMERAWLDQLANALRLEPGLARELEQQVQVAARV
ncbi:tellurite resistance TerB family protein [Marinobacter sp. TBZ242]|uniref:Tellurite resistance TerB family protein n=1 Tax=Marinobacter azerbaijanicus TaxID=3050455 RepID=A0ABT7IBI7_9GAMM|nr:tellurite resistance TerB family protein [Marinobacter sp. TBZ242]MDL0430484.1 tellurite resistance TerB family protein [Marinobacter sp. TBZ242]